MAFARTATVTHNKVATAADDPTKEINRGEWNDAHAFTSAVSGATSGGIPYCPTATTEATSANLTFSGTGSVAGGPQLQVGSGNSGFKFGNYDASDSAIWSTGVTQATTNYGILINSVGSVVLNVPSSNQQISMYVADATIKFNQLGTAGRGPDITAGTATTDVAALSITRTNNHANVLRGVEFLFTDTTSGAFTPLWIKGGAAAATSLLKLSKVGLLDCPSYAVGGAAGASFGPGLPTSITVVNGIITAIN